MAAVFITGAAGFVGKALTKALLADGWRVYGMCRTQQQADDLRAMGAQPILADLKNLDAFEWPTVDYVVHAAALVGKAAPASTYYDINAAATLQLARKSAAAGVKKWVFISSQSVSFSAHHQPDMDETLPFSRIADAYIQSKVAAEKGLMEVSALSGMPVYCLRPTIIWGEGDTVQLPLMQAAINSGRFRWIDDGKAMLQPTYIGNLVHACRLLLQAPEVAAGPYLIADAERHTQQQFWRQLLGRQVRKWPTASLPFGLVWPAAIFFDRCWRLLRLKSKPPLSRVAALSFGRTHTVRYQKASAAFGYAPKYSFDEAYRTFTFDR